MKKNKIVIGFLFLLIVLISFTMSVQAVDITKSTIQKNLESYAMTGKVASAVIGNSRYTVGGDAAGIASLAMTDDTLSFISSNTPVVYKYKVEGNVCTFIVESDITEETDTNDYLTTTLNINLLSACFLSVTDSFDVDSNDALYYYEERVEQIKKDLDYEGIDNRDYLNIAKRYVEKIGMVDDTVFHQYTKVINNSNTNCKYQTILEIKLNQVSKIYVERPVTETTPTQTEEQNVLVPVNNVENTTGTNTTSTNANTTSNETANQLANSLEESIGNLTNQTDRETAEEVTGADRGAEEKGGSGIFKGIAIVVIIALVITAIVLYERRKK